MIQPDVWQSVTVTWTVTAPHRDWIPWPVNTTGVELRELAVLCHQAAIRPPSLDSVRR